MSRGHCRTCGQALPTFRISVVTFRDIVREVCGYYGITPELLVDKERRKRAVMARRMVCFLAREHTNLSSPELGRMLERHHTTVLYCAAEAARRLQDSRWLGDVVALEERIGIVDPAKARRAA